jgi:hypothetical protein
VSWELVRLRFYHGNRPQQTPRQVLWQGRWRLVRLLAEELHQRPAPDGQRRRRWLVECADDGTCLEIEGPQGGPWRARVSQGGDPFR